MLLFRVSHSIVFIVVIIIFINHDCVEDFLIFIFNVYLPVGTSGHGCLVAHSHLPFLLLFHREIYEHGSGSYRTLLWPQACPLDFWSSGHDSFAVGQLTSFCSFLAMHLHCLHFIIIVH